MQNYKNHRQLNPFHHFVITPITLVLLVWSTIHFFNSDGTFNQNIFNVLISVCLIMIAFMARSFALKNQDRIIRMEMRQRYFEMTGKSFAEKEKQLRLGQIIALRFAGDEELMALIERAIAEKLTSKDIKMAIKNWQGDYRRV